MSSRHFERKQIILIFMTKKKNQLSKLFFYEFRLCIDQGTFVNCLYFDYCECLQIFHNKIN